MAKSKTAKEQASTIDRVFADDLKIERSNESEGV